MLHFSIKTTVQCCRKKLPLLLGIRVSMKPALRTLVQCQFACEVICLVMFVYSCTAETLTPVGLYPLPHPDGVTTEEALQLLLSPTNNVTVMPHIPKGSKRNVYCLIDNRENQKRRAFGHRSNFDDDCGPWQSSKSSCVTSSYIADNQNSLKRIFWVASQQAYCSEMKVEGKRLYNPMDPQPSPDTVVKIRRYYVKLAVNDAYRRRITTLVKSTVAAKHNVAIVEYFDHSPSTTVPAEGKDVKCGSQSKHFGATTVVSHAESMEDTGEETGNNFETNCRCVRCFKSIVCYCYTWS